MMWTCAAKDYFFGIDQVEKNFFYDIFWLEILQRVVDWEQGRFSESLQWWWLKSKMWVLLLRSFLLPVCVCPKKKKKKKKKRDSDVARELFCYVQSGQKELQLYSNQMIFPLKKLPHNFCGGGNNFIVAYKKDGIFLWLCKSVFLFKYFILGLFIDRFYLICQVLLKIYFFFIPDLNTGFGTLTHISKSWQIFPSGEREKKYLFFLQKPYSDFVCMHTKTAS